MNNLEHLKTFDIDKMTSFFSEFQIYKCMFCKYHYDKGNCDEKDCDEGMKEWLSKEADTDFWKEFDVHIEKVKEIKKRYKNE